MVPGIVARTDVFKSERPNRRRLRYVLTRFRPVEMRRIARLNDDASGRVGAQLIGIEFVAKTDVENANIAQIAKLAGPTVFA